MEFALQIGSLLLLIPLWILPNWIIVLKTGYNPFWSLLCVIPGLNLIYFGAVAWILVIKANLHPVWTLLAFVPVVNMIYFYSLALSLPPGSILDPNKI